MNLIIRNVIWFHMNRNVTLTQDLLGLLRHSMVARHHAHSNLEISYVIMRALVLDETVGTQ